MVGWAVFEKEQLQVTGEVATYQSSADGRRQFCPRCGTSLFYLNDVLFAGLVDVQIGTFDDPDAVTPREQIQLAERVGWMERAHELPGFERWPD